MPCDGSYMEPSRLEKNLAIVLRLIDEAERGVPFTADAYDRRAYGCASQERLDEATANLCALLKGRDVSRYSLELQIWWRDHQRADEDRERREAEEQRVRDVRAKALSKLTVVEREALGLGGL